MKSRPDLKIFSKYKHPKKQSFLFYILLPIQWKIWTKLDIENLIFTNFKTFLMPNPKFQSTGELLCKPYQINWLGTCVQWLPSFQQPEKYKKAIFVYTKVQFNNIMSGNLSVFQSYLRFKFQSTLICGKVKDPVQNQCEADQVSKSNVKITQQTND